MAEMEQVFREKMQNRRDLAAVVDEIEKGTFVPVLSDAELDAEIAQKAVRYGRAGFDTPEERAHRARAREQFFGMKLERNAYVAIFLPQIWARFESERDGALEAQSEYIRFHEETLRRMSMTTKELFSRHVNEWQAQMRTAAASSGVTDPQMQKKIEMFSRFEKLMEFAEAKMYIREASPSRFINNGVGTATEVSFSLARLLTVKHSEVGTLNKEAYTKSLDIALRSIPVQFAMLDQNIVSPVLDAILDVRTGFNEKYFTFEDRDGAIAMKINWDEIAKIEIDDPSSEDGKTSAVQVDTSATATGCPAAIAKSEHNVNVLRDHIFWIRRIVLDNFDAIASEYEKSKGT